MKKESIWNEYFKEELEPLKENIKCDILIIGGGLSGLLTAYYLDKCQKKVVLVERGQLLRGVTSKMTAKVTPLQDILKKITEKNRTLYIKSQLTGLKLLKENIVTNNISCDFLKTPSYLFTTKKSNIAKLKKIEKNLDEAKVPLTIEEFPLKDLKALYSIKTEESYVLNPLKYLKGIKDSFKNVTIYDKTAINMILKEGSSFIAKTNYNYEIATRKIVFATNYPYFLKPLFFPLKVHLEKSYIGYMEPNFSYQKEFSAINIDKKVSSIRFYQKKILYLTGSNKLASNINDSKNFEKIETSLIGKNLSHFWSNMDIVTNDNLPMMGEFLKNMYILTGYNSWGLLSSHLGALMISSLILRRKKGLKYQELFNPKKQISLKKTFNSSVNVYESINGYIKGMFTKNKAIFYSQKEAMYVSETGDCYVVKRKCPHLKCNLIFNSTEKTWDCPCHGSRFDLLGNVISGPSCSNIKIKNVK